MWRCAVLLLFYCIGLAAGQEFDVDSDPFPTFNLDCGKNEYFEQCTHECPPEKTCKTRKINISCTEELMPCNPKCVCKDGYYRKTEGGKCIPEDECGPACGENEVYTECRSSCLNETCAAVGKPVPSCAEPCTPGCVCEEGFFRSNEYWPCYHKCYCKEFRDTPECSD